MLLTQKSRFFQGALSGAWSESKARAVELPEDDPALFAYYASWILGTNPFSSSKVTCSARQERHSEAHSQHETLIKFYLLGEKLGDHEFMDLALSALVEAIEVHAGFFPSLARIIYTEALPDSELKRFWITKTIESPHTSGLLKTNKADLPVDFIYDVALALAENKEKLYDAVLRPKKLSRNVCNLHMHSKDGKPCPVEKLPSNSKKRKFCNDDDDDESEP